MNESDDVVNAATVNPGFSPWDHVTLNTTMDAGRVVYDTLVFADAVYITINGGPYRRVSEDSSFADTDLSRLDFSETQMRESDEPVSSKLLVLAAERGIFLTADERFRVLRDQALLRLNSFINVEFAYLRRETERGFRVSISEKLRPTPSRGLLTAVAGGDSPGFVGGDSPDWQPRFFSQAESRLHRPSHVPPHFHVVGPGGTHSHTITGGYPLRERGEPSWATAHQTKVWQDMAAAAANANAAASVVLGGLR